MASGAQEAWEGLAGQEVPRVGPGQGKRRWGVAAVALVRAELGTVLG